MRKPGRELDASACRAAPARALRAFRAPPADLSAHLRDSWPIVCRRIAQRMRAPGSSSASCARSSNALSAEWPLPTTSTRRLDVSGSRLLPGRRECRRRCAPWRAASPMAGTPEAPSDPGVSSVPDASITARAMTSSSPSGPITRNRNGASCRLPSFMRSWCSRATVSTRVLQADMRPELVRSRRAAPGTARPARRRSGTRPPPASSSPVASAESSRRDPR